MSNRQVPVNDWPVMVRWIFANFAGWSGGLSLGIFLTFTAGMLNGVNEDRLFIIAILLSVGLTCGVAQWVVIREYLPRSRSWIVGTLAGYVLALLILQIIDFIRIPSMGLWGNVLLLAMMGAAIGIPQWWLLRTRYRGTGLWILATGIGFLAFLWLIINPPGSESVFTVTTAILGAFAATATGAVLAWLVRQPQSELR